MRPLVLPLALLLTAAAPPSELQSWRKQAEQVTITRDDHGIAHIKGPTDADAVFGMIYAQAEDDFPRIEANYLTALGRTAEADSEKAIWQDLRARLYVSEPELKNDYAKSPEWLKKLMNAWAAGLNYYLATHPGAKPRVLARFEPWMALSFTEGSIGGDIERIDLNELEWFYGGTAKLAAAPYDPEPRGSNGIAIAPALTRDGKSLLLINPHTSFFFRSEQQVTSGEGLNAYGAATWGQFFIYQGFNSKAGWMHTSSGVDSADEFLETVQREGRKHVYRYGTGWRPLIKRPVSIRYRRADGKLASRQFMTYRTHHGPIIRSEPLKRTIHYQTANGPIVNLSGGEWVSFAMMNRPVAALQQSFLRTKAGDLASFLEIARLAANSSNNTIFADAGGQIAYLHPQFVPRRSDKFDYTQPVDGSDPATDWGSPHSLAELPSVISPPNGWVQNTNTWPYRAAGAFSPKPEQFPKYMDMFGENFRGIHTVKLLEGSRGWTLPGLQAAAYDSYQPGFAALIPGLIAAWDQAPDSDQKQALAEPIAVLRGWDYCWGADSVAMTLASFWAQPLWEEAREGGLSHMETFARINILSDPNKLAALAAAVERLNREYGTWRTPWGEINRFQRISPEIVHPFSDDAPSIPVPFGSGNFGSLASFGAAPRNGSKRWYGTSGNSFVAVVEFGPRVRAVAVSAGGESGDPTSPHFNDQAARYAAGALRPIYFYPDELQSHVERQYRPGE